MRSSVPSIRRSWSLRSQRRQRPTILRRRLNPAGSPRRKPLVSRLAPTIQIGRRAPHRPTMRRMRRHMPHRQNRMRLTRRRRPIIAAMSRPAGAPINRSALRTALISRMAVRGACAAWRPSSAPTASKETSHDVGPGAGARIRVKWIEERGGGSMTGMTTTRMTWACSAEAAAGRGRISSKSPPT